MMKRTLLFKTLLLLCAFIVGASNSLWAADVTYTFNSKSWGATVAETSANWISGKDATNMTKDRGVKIETGASGANATSPISFYNISQIVVTYSTNASSGVGKIKFQVGSGVEQSQDVDKKDGTTDRNLTYTFSPNESGKVKITVDCTTNAIYVKSVTITYEKVKVSTPTISLEEGLYYLYGSDTKSVELSTETADANIYYTIDGSTPTSESTLYEGAISVSSSETVKAIAIKDGLADSDVASAEYTIITSIPTRSPKNVGSNYFVKVTNVEDLENGDAVLIVNSAEDKAMGAQNGSSYREQVDVSPSNGTIFPLPTGAKTVVLIKPENGNNRFFFSPVDEATKYLYANGSGINTSTVGYAKSNALASVDIADNGTATIKFLGDNTRNLFRYNSDRFSCYASATGTSVYLYKEVPVTISINAACNDGAGNYYSTYSNTNAFVVPSDLTVSEISVSGKAITMHPYTTGDVVAANTGVLVSSTTSGDHVVELTTAEATNLGVSSVLHPTGTGLTADEMASANPDCTYYRLTMHNGTDIGFYYGAESGAAFAIAANKAYLAVPILGGGAREGLWFNDDITGIEAVKAAAIENGVYYNLAGQRVAQPTKGLYIVNGKKVTMK